MWVCKWTCVSYHVILVWYVGCNLIVNCTTRAHGILDIPIQQVHNLTCQQSERQAVMSGFAFFIFGSSQVTQRQRFPRWPVTLGTPLYTPHMHSTAPLTLRDIKHTPRWYNQVWHHSFPFSVHNTLIYTSVAAGWKCFFFTNDCEFPAKAGALPVHSSASFALRMDFRCARQSGIWILISEWRSRWLCWPQEACRTPRFSSCLHPKLHEVDLHGSW